MISTARNNTPQLGGYDFEPQKWISNIRNDFYGLKIIPPSWRGMISNLRNGFLAFEMISTVRNNTPQLGGYDFEPQKWISDIRNDFYGSKSYPPAGGVSFRTVEMDF
jgi:hypothetical protein